MWRSPIQDRVTRIRGSKQEVYWLLAGVLRDGKVVQEVFLSRREFELAEEDGEFQRVDK